LVSLDATLLSQYATLAPCRTLFCTFARSGPLHRLGGDEAQAHMHLHHDIVSQQPD
jgi:hypothetical protein